MTEEISSDALVVRDIDHGSPLPVFTGKEMVGALRAYRELQRALDAEMPEQIMELDGRPFRKKGYWRAVAVAFHLTVKPASEERRVEGAFMDGRENFGWAVTYSAAAPSGRVTTGDGTCFAVEKARRFRCPHPERPGSRRTLHFPAEQCPDFDPGYQWRSLPAQATEHNVRSHANTRAFNRAVSNLVGFGEVSAEEVERDERHDESQDTRSSSEGGGIKPPQRKSETNGGKKATEAQVKLIRARAGTAKIGDDDLHAHLHAKLGVDHVADVPFEKVDEVLAWIQAGGKAA